MQCDILCRKEFLKLQEENEELKEEIKELSERIQKLTISFSTSYIDN